MTTQADCIFCRIAAGEIPADVVAEGDEWIAFRDLSPQAPAHLLVIPRAHVVSLSDASATSGGLGDAMLAGCREAADVSGLTGGYRVLTNVGEDGGQEVMHLHFHVLGGRRLGWPPG